MEIPGWIFRNIDMHCFAAQPFIFVYISFENQ